VLKVMQVQVKLGGIVWGRVLKVILRPLQLIIGLFKSKPGPASAGES